MDMNQMTERLREALTLAQQEGIRRQQQTVEPEHVLWALLAQERGLAGSLLTKCGISLELARARVAEAMDLLPRVTGSMEANKVYVSSNLQEILVDAFDRAKKMGDAYVSIEHVLLAMATRMKLLRDLGLSEKNAIEFEIGIKEDAEHKGGLNLFGSKFGDYRQHINFTVTYSG